MRQADREVKDLSEIIEIMKRCDVCRLALNHDSGFPYIVPLNFGIMTDSDIWTGSESTADSGNMTGSVNNTIPPVSADNTGNSSIHIRLVFHSALEGTKIDLLKRDPRASFEMDCRHQLQYDSEKGYCTMAYESVIGRGTVHILGEAEKLQVLRALMDQYHPGQNAFFNPAAMSRTLCWCLDIETLTAKRKLPKKMV